MKKVVQGKQLNTETAKLIGEHSHLLPGDLDYFSESLYRTKSGNYFIYGEGGPRSQYARQSGQNNWSGGYAFELLSREQAARWAEEHLTADEYVAEFGEPDEDETNAITVRISAAARAKLEAERGKTGETLSTIVDKAIKNL
jgi:hypothetical protein